MSNTALIVVDMFNPYDHEDAERLVESAEQAVPVIAKLVERAGDEGAELIYVNDNHGDWNSSQEQLVETARKGRRPDLIDPLVPPKGASFVIKARHTIFFETPLGYLLTQLGAERVVLTGQVTEQCILYSALDAYVRHLEVAVPQDAVAHIHEDLADAALRMMRENMRADTPRAADVRFD